MLCKNCTHADYFHDEDGSCTRLGERIGETCSCPGLVVDCICCEMPLSKEDIQNGESYCSGCRSLDCDLIPISDDEETASREDYFNAYEGDD